MSTAEEIADVTRADYEADGEACERSPLCQLIAGHGGSCDPRTELERAAAVLRLIDMADAITTSDDDGTTLASMVETSARMAMAVKLAGGRP